MAIVVPILVSYGATALGVAATTATMLATVTSLAFQVTGINNKINKAASKVFGEDLVMVANIAGAVYGAVNGGFDFGSGAENASSINAVNGLDAADNAFVAAGGTVSDGLSAVSSIDPSSALAVNGMDAASGAFSVANADAGGKLVSDGFGINLADMAAPAPDLTSGTDLVNDVGTLGKDLSTRIPDSSAVTQGNTVAPPSTASGNVAAGADASGLRAAAKQAAMSSVDATAKNAAANVQPGSFFDRLGGLAKSDKVLGAVIQGAGGALTSAASNKQKQREHEDLMKLKTSVPTLYTKR